MAVTTGVDVPHTVLLDDALEIAGFWTLLAARRASLRRRESTLRIVIKPDLDVFVIGAPTATDPLLVEHLVAQLRARGYLDVTLCDGRNIVDNWLHNRDALCVPDLAGYHFEAPEGSPYQFAWMDDEATGIPLDRHDDSSALQVNGAWAHADVRISFAKAKTDDSWGYALGASNLLGLVSTEGDAPHWQPADRALQLLRRSPPHFVLIDATIGSHGNAGSRMPEPIMTDTIIASPHLLLADWVGALKMGADPYVSPINALALEHLPLPAAWSLHGDASPWPGWRNPTPIHLDAVRSRARWPELDALANAILQPSDVEHFPFRDVIVEQIAATVRNQLQRVTDANVRDWIETMLAAALGTLAASREAFTGNVTKGEVVQSLAPITLDLESIEVPEYDRTANIVEMQARNLDGVPDDPRGFRIRTVGGHIHFAASRILPLPFDDFVERVDISSAIRVMNDYVGGSWRVVDRDKSGRPRRQAERNVYLAQPNWTGLFGAPMIDVEKLEVMSYSRDQHRIDWRTVLSPNRSAESDDGSVVFRRTGNDTVEVHVVARQRFTLPPILAAARIERWSGVHAEMVADAYSRFFDGTLSNMRAVFDGAEYRIGRAPRLVGVMESGSDLRALLTGAMALVSRVLGWATPRSDGTGVSQPLAIDDLGFAHFAGSHGSQAVTTSSRLAANGVAHDAGALTPMSFLTELGRAVGRDIAAMGVPQFTVAAAESAR